MISSLPFSMQTFWWTNDPSMRSLTTESYQSAAEESAEHRMERQLDNISRRLAILEQSQRYGQ